MANVFSGDIKNLRVFSDKSGTLVPRAFSDPLLLIAKQSVSFKGIIRGPVRKMSVRGRLDIMPHIVHEWLEYFHQ